MTTEERITRLETQVADLQAVTRELVAQFATMAGAIEGHHQVLQQSAEVLGNHRACLEQLQHAVGAVVRQLGGVWKKQPQSVVTVN